MKLKKRLSKIQSTIENNIIFFETMTALFFLIITLMFSEEPIKFGFPFMIGLILYFMIFIELTRALMDFIFGKEHKFKVRYIYDMGIIFVIREILVTITAKHHIINQEITFLIICGILLLILFILRIIDTKVFKYINNCQSCKYTFEEKK